MHSDSFIFKITPCMPLLPASEHHRPLAGTHFTVPRRAEGWVDLGSWLHTEIKCRLRESNPDTVTHPSTNRAQRRLTSLIETNYVTTTPCRHPQAAVVDVDCVWTVVEYISCSAKQCLESLASCRAACTLSVYAATKHFQTPVYSQCYIWQSWANRL